MKLTSKTKNSPGVDRMIKAGSAGARKGITAGLKSLGIKATTNPGYVKQQAQKRFKHIPQDIMGANGVQYSVRKLKLKVWVNAPYAAIQNYGGTIKAKYSPYLMFQPKGSNHLVRVKQVTIKANKFFTEAIKKIRDQMDKEIMAGIKRKIGIK